MKLKGHKVFQPSQHVAGVGFRAKNRLVNRVWTSQTRDVLTRPWESKGL